MATLYADALTPTQPGPSRGSVRTSWVDRAVLDLVSAQATLRRALEAPARIERLALALDRAAALLDVLVTEVDPERIRHTVARLDRLAASAEKAAAMIDWLEVEVDVERLGETITRVSRLSATAEDVAVSLHEAVGGRLSQPLTMLDRLLAVAEEMNRNIRQIEGLLEGVRGVVGAPLQNLPLPSLLRRVLRDPAAGPEAD
ncbi:MAG TPA: hypothetical protein VGE42_10625 [Candidatus Dormibacteraeota bacterium]